MLHILLDALFPKRSPTGVWDEQLTHDEYISIRRNARTEYSESLERRGIYYIDLLHTACDYHDSLVLQKMLKHFKYNRITSLQPYIADLFLESLSESNVVRGTLCPVPLHWSRRFHRGYNQSFLLAEYIGKKLSLPTEELLVRCKKTRAQALQTKAQRHKNIQNCFSIITESVPPIVILVDDIVTTGVTLDACAKALKDNGVKFVAAWAIARS